MFEAVGEEYWPAYFAKVRDQLALGQDIGADTVCLTDWMVNRWIQLGYTQELNKANIPNAANLVPSLQNPQFDPGRVHSLPWQGGFAGIAYNVEETGEVRSVSDLWRPDLAGRVGVLSEMRDTIGVIMLENGVDISGDFTADEFNAALDIFRTQVESGQIRNVRGNAYTEDLVNGDTLAAICWSGDITLLNFEAGYEKWKFVLPEGGATLWNDNFLIPIGSTRKTNAETLINYYYEPEVAAEVAAWVNYITPVEGAKEAAIAIVSLAASSAHEVPRGLDFLLNRNRLNVAISRAQWAAYLVHSPGLTDALPHTPQGVAELSAFIRLTEEGGIAN